MALLTTKRCSKCGLRKSLNKFYNNPRSRDGLASYCKLCHNKSAEVSRHNHLERQRLTVSRHRARNPELYKACQIRYSYNIDLDQYNRLLSKQNGVCGICKSADPGCGRKYLCVDHDHSCCPGEKSCGNCIRGLLCDRCNRGLGQFNDSAGIISNAIEYLKNYRRT